ncbi:multiheme c-type cytochrome [Ferrimonas balearica]|uniref:multiheme c-type cytochrome n=1 Tax=Ferrimonas balearica TaxID=44012 RepID=UPI001C938C4C|nr:multiheme c-type cytochrome [Ferrimonas balearica]MBY6225378.1 cytochrome C [Ferrimonas balearica]
MKRPTLLTLLLCAALPAAASTTQPFAPSYLTVKDGAEAELKHFSSPEGCKRCHPRQYAGWQGSMHSIAFIDPVYQAEAALGTKETDGATHNLCKGCHTAIGTVSENISYDASTGKFGGFTTQGVAERGVSCDTCHSVSATNIAHTEMGEHGNASLELATDRIKRGPFDDAKARGHKTEYSELHTRSEFCANCHNVFNPVHGNFPLEHTYEEWKNSDYAKAEIQCQDCHMVPVEVAVRVADEMKPVKALEQHRLSGQAARGGPVRSVVHDHGFVGGNAVLAPLLGVEGGEAHAQEATKRLQTVAELETALVEADGKAQLNVTVHNRRAGHDLPTSLSFIRQVWLEVVIEDAQGNTLLRSGTLNADNSLPADTVVFQDTAVDADGKPEHKPWKIARFSVENSIPAKGSKTVEYGFTLPADGHYTVTTTLHYRSFDQSVADYLLTDSVTVPSVTMNRLTQRFEGTRLISSDNSL